MYDDYDDGRPVVVVCGSTTRRSRVARVCQTCGEDIGVGDLYERRAYKVDGDMTAAPFHLGH